ncbi:PucR family transcriptional regulator [Paenibacillus lemnae]|uniref:PucR family transcriptional regulator n=1 Tax=Paenibacillus lemnae TaxID=1330551 RepID=A0A848MDZ0_PAELE|nr:helix-turn-helix domain-containing protein [Paenibacillus lemnae]NMO98272.1 PucR family transcriptional regulator [Paenibacillus lemnae]
MAEMQHIVQTLKQSLNITITHRKLDQPNIQKVKAAIDVGEKAYYYELENEIWIPVIKDETEDVIVARQEDLTESEVNLISLWLASLQNSGNLPAAGAKYELEQQAKKLGEWIKERLTSGDLAAQLPKDTYRSGSLAEEMIAFLLMNESDHAVPVDYKTLQRLVRSYFDGEIVLVPLMDNEWLILAKQELLQGIKEDLDDSLHEKSQEKGQDPLYSFCIGLHELISTEWVGDFHISCIPDIDGLHRLPQSVQLLRQTMKIGRTFQVKEPIHLSTGLHLERLLYSIPEDQRSLFLQEYAAGQSHLFDDPETMSTLEFFFELDCNVSETAKRLYIHRNTLLYRLDKIKQETGLDVRSFNDAVLVKISLLLYKLTKRF